MFVDKYYQMIDKAVAKRHNVDNERSGKGLYKTQYKYQLNQ